LGWLMGKHGLSIDNLISADVVTADGQFRKASVKDNSDLFWALRGGGGNFGVVTSLEYRLHPVTQVLGGMVIYPLDQARDVQRFWRSALTEQISDALIDVMVEGASSFSSPMSALLFFHMHGAAARVSPTATAFAPRRAQWDFDAIGQWADGRESATHIAWVRALWGKLEPHLKGSAYVNHLAADDRPEKVRASFGENYALLRTLKAAYDPKNLFRVNANI